MSLQKALDQLLESGQNIEGATRITVRTDLLDALAAAADSTTAPDVLNAVRDLVADADAAGAKTGRTSVSSVKVLAVMDLLTPIEAAATVTEDAAAQVA